MGSPIFSPQNPFIGAVRIFPGAMLKVNGKAQPNASRFAINLQLGPSLSPRDDLALHLSPCFTPPRVVRNSLIRGNWGIEEAWSNGVVVNPHQPFEIIILCESDQFKIAINGGHFCEFKHRVPYHQITHLTIDGDVDISQIDMQPAGVNLGSASQPSAPYPVPSAPSGMPMPSLYPNVGPIPSGAGYTPSMPSPYPQHPPPPNQPSSGPAGPMPTGAGYSTGFPNQPNMPYQPNTPYQPNAPYQPNMPYQTPHGGGPAGPTPTGAGYMSGYPHQPQPQPTQPGPSSSIPGLGNLPIGGKALGALAGIGIGAAATAAALSVAGKPLKHMKKMMKPKIFKHSGFKRSSSSSSDSSRSSFSSNSS